MTTTTNETKSGAHSIRRWVRRAFLIWAVISITWLANSVRTQGVSDTLLQSTEAMAVVEEAGGLEFQPTKRDTKTSLIFICGSGIHPHAYVPLLRPIAERGYSVFIVKLPYRFAPLSSHQDEVLDQTRKLMAAHPEATQWVIAGHSLGGALAARVAQTDPRPNTAFVLIGTTHPKEVDLSKLSVPFTKVYASNDGIAPVERVMATKKLLPESTKWVEIKGGNHSQFGHYGHQLSDGAATITREVQQTITREAILEALRSLRSDS